MDIYLLRHPPVQLQSGICYGQTDVKLVTGYMNYIRPVKRELPNNLKIYSSDSTRCRLAAEGFHQDKVFFDPRLRELNFGEWENKAWKDLPLEAISQWNRELDTFTIPEGESFNTLKARMVDAWLDILAEKKDSLIVTHAGSIRAIISHLLNAPAKAVFSIELDYASITKITMNKNWHKIAYINRVYS